MRILYDGQVYGMQVVGGVNRYFDNLILRLPSDFAPSLLVSQVQKFKYPPHANLNIYEYDRMRLGSISYRVSLGLSRLENFYIRRLLAATRFDLAHPTYYTLLTGREIAEYRCPVVLTVWDMIHERFPETMDRTGQYTEQKRRALHSADMLICISESTRNDLLERYPAIEERVRVTHLAASIDARMSHGPEPVPSRPYFMYVGSRTSYKNFDLLLSAFAGIADACAPAALCVVGSPFSEGEQKRIAELRLTGRVEIINHPTDSHLAKLYRSSIALVYPSLYEGFGIPPLEAMSCGTPVVASNRSSLPEVVGDAGILFDPCSTEELSDILLRLLGDSSERERLIERGFRRSRQFSWDKTAEQTIDIYRAVGKR